MKKFCIWFFAILLALTAAAGGYAYYNGVRNWSELVAFTQTEWQRITGAAPEATDGPDDEDDGKLPDSIEMDLDSMPQAEIMDMPEEDATNRFNIFAAAEDEEYNPMLLGHWVCNERPTWHRIYTDEYSGNGYYWGKEWDEAEDVSEEDLIDYGNGWFEWKMDGNDVLELATTDMSEARVPFIYTIKKLSDKDLVYIEQRSTEKRTFTRQ